MDIFQKPEWIQELQSDWEVAKEKWEAISHFFDVFFSIFPPEIILFLVGVILFLAILNGISPTTTKTNLVISALFYDTLWVFFNSVFFSSWKILSVLWANFYLLVPFLIISGFRLGIRWFQNVYARNFSISRKDLIPLRQAFNRMEESIAKDSIEYSALVQELHNIQRLSEMLLKKKSTLNEASESTHTHHN